MTLVGPGGVGKTRLALEVGARRVGRVCAFGGCLVELAPVGDPAGVRAAIAAALDLPDPTRLAELIGDRELLIVLDNCEHVIDDRRRGRRGPAAPLPAACASSPRAAKDCASAARPSGRCRRSTADDAVQLFVARAQAAGRAARRCPTTTMR